MATHLDSLPDPLSPPERTTATVRRGAKALIAAEPGVLLVKERHGDGTPFWTLPGGGCRPGETLGEALRRELREELDCEVQVAGPVASFWYAHSSCAHTLSRHTVFRTRLLSRPVPVRTEGIEAYRWADPASVPAATLPQVRHLLGRPRERS